MSIATKSVFEMSDGELSAKLEPMAATIRKRAWDHHSYISYYDQAVCPGTDFVIREYKDRKELVLLGDSGVAKLIRVL